MAEYRTRTGKVLTEADLDALAEEAERGYEIDPAKGVTCTCERDDKLAITAYAPDCPIHAGRGTT